MDTFETIKKRFSCRSYTDKKVNDNDLIKILDAGIKAPTGGNLQPWNFIVVDNDGVKEALVKACLSQKWMLQAPLFIVICGDSTNPKRFYKTKGELYIIQDCAVAAENMMIAATALDLRTCWVGAFDVNAIKRILKLPPNVEPFTIMPLGYSNEKIPEKKRHSIDTFVYFNEHGNFDSGKDIFPISKHKKEVKTFLDKIKNKF
ncbi:MAG: nitroreductase family protein [Nanoarchaeota archaeon]|nr:nitroreductase family protein [Nanoarchaeota archaeon]